MEKCLTSESHHGVSSGEVPYSNDYNLCQEATKPASAADMRF